ncbi:toll/interleukin-1 receptor domain-containing protein [bacterium]|nr:toll/interleukin-1 receptor domain-containing protein [bacterium]MBU1753316.1 toll/interleukin-1 receptor domain-containing protein [bacterium]
MYSVFISHSTQDRGLVIALAHILTKFEIKVFVAEWYLTPGEPVRKKVFEKIEKSDCIVALLTQNGVRSNWVNQEIECALKAGRTLIPIVEKGVNINDLAALQGKEYIEYDPHQYEDALSKTAGFVKLLKLKKQEQKKALLVAGGILAFFLLLSSQREGK